jgi:3-phenylpropionate/cinnamic acid dioxygenase small subunit
MSTTTERAIPSAGPDMRHLLDQDVVIAGDDTKGATGAQAIEPTHSPRSKTESGTPLPAAALLAVADLQREVEQFLYRQAELLDDKQWQAWMDCFADDGLYWMPARPEQTDWDGTPSIFIEDKLLMEVRKGRVMHPNAWSQAPLWETNHIVSHVTIESSNANEVVARSRFHMMELRRDSIRHFGGRYRHTLRRQADGALKIHLQRVDLFNAQAPFDYVIQIWI